MITILSLSRVEWLKTEGAVIYSLLDSAHFRMTGGKWVKIDTVTLRYDWITAHKLGLSFEEAMKGFNVLDGSVDMIADCAILTVEKNFNKLPEYLCYTTSYS